MNKNVAVRYLFVGLIAAAALVFGANGYAYKDMAGSKAGKGCGGCNRYGQSGGCGKAGAVADLTPEQREQIEAERIAFIEATKDEREALNDKKTALWAEIAEEAPDVQKASMLQEEISQLRASLDQKLLTHVIAVRKINPDAGKGFFMEHRGARGNRAGAGDCPYQQ